MSNLGRTRLASGEGRKTGAFGAIRARLGTTALALVVITLGALVIRLIGLGARDFWGDEFFALRAARKPLADLFFPQLIDNGTQIGFYVVAHAWTTLFPALAAPVDPAGMRVLTLLFSVATIPVVYAIVADLAARLRLPNAARTALPLLAAGLLAVSPFAVRYAQEFRAYTLQLFLLSLGTLLLLRAFDGRAPRGWWIAYGLLAAATVYVHMLSGVFLAAQVGALFVLALYTARRRLALGLIGATLLAAPLVAPLPITLLIHGSSPMDWVPPLSLPGVVETLSSFLAVPPGFETATNLQGMASIPAGDVPLSRLPLLVIAAVPSLIGAVRLWRGRREAPASVALLLVPLLLVPPLFALSSIVAAKIWWTRYMYMLLLPMISLSALGTLEIIRFARARWVGGRRVVATLCALLLVATSLITAAGLVSMLDRRAGPDWNISHRAALTAARARWAENAVRDYAFTLEVRCYCDSTVSGPFRVSVNERGASVLLGGTLVAGDTLLGQPPTAETLFAFIESRLDVWEGEQLPAPGPDEFRATYDPLTGLPVRVWTGALPGEPRAVPRGFNLTMLQVEIGSGQE